jgi:integrase
MTSIRSGQTQYLTQNELSRFFRIIERTPSRRQARDLALFHFMYLLGARASEIGTLRRDDIKDSTGEVVLRRLKGSWFTTIRLDKPRQWVLKAWLNERPGQHPTDPLFPSQKAGKCGELQGIKRSAIYRLTARY